MLGLPYKALGDLLIIGPASAHWELYSINFYPGAIIDVNVAGSWSWKLSLFKNEKYVKDPDADTNDTSPKVIIDDIFTIDVAINAPANEALTLNLEDNAELTLEESLYTPTENYNGSGKYGFKLKDGITEDDAEDSEFLLGLTVGGHLPSNLSGEDSPWSDATASYFTIEHSSNRDLNSETIYACHRQEGYR
jgi:hypothetical protein